MPGSRGLTGPDKAMLSVLLTGEPYLTLSRLAHLAGKRVRKHQALLLVDYLIRMGRATSRRGVAGEYFALTEGGQEWARAQLGRAPGIEEITAEPEGVL